MITYRPPAGAGPDHLVTHRIAAITTDPTRRPRVPHQGRRQRRSPTRGRSRSASPTQARVRAGVPYVGFAICRARPTAGVRMLAHRPSRAADRALEPRRPVARDRRRGRRSPRVKRALLALARPGRARPVRRSARPSATFVAASSQPRRNASPPPPTSTPSPSSLADPGTPLRGTVALSATAGLRPRPRQRALPELARGRRARGPTPAPTPSRPYTLRLRHDHRRRRAARPPRRRARHRRLQPRTSASSPRRRDRQHRAGHAR